MSILTYQFRLKDSTAGSHLRENMMKWIHLGCEYYTCVDDETYEDIKDSLWHITKFGYAVGVTGKYLKQLLHLVIVPTLSDDLETDHINRAKWDNQRLNLRRVTRTINQANKGIPDNPPFPTEEEKHAAKAWRIIVRQRNIAHRANIARTMKGKKGIPVKDHFGNLFPSAYEASRQTGINPSHISHCCTGTRLSAGGRRWEYAA